LSSEFHDQINFMKKAILTSVLSVFVLAFVFGQAVCDTPYWDHTYANARLKVYQGCASITGTIKSLLPPTFTGDGDYHIYILPDTQYAWMVSYRDTNYLKLCEGSDSAGYRLICIPCLNVEEVCKGAPTASGGVVATVDSACLDFNDTTYVPNVGEYVRATGPFIYDTVHCWNELHPVSSMIVLNPLNIPEPEGGSFTDEMKIFPQPADKDMEFAFQHPPHALTLIKLYNIAGQQLFVYGLAETSVLYLDISTWPSGQYLYSIVSQEQGRVLKSGVFSVVH
jgi:hypothetical protein